MASAILRAIIGTEAFNSVMIRAIPMSILLQDAYYDYRCDIFANKTTVTQFT